MLSNQISMMKVQEEDSEFDSNSDDDVVLGKGQRRILIGTVTPIVMTPIVMRPRRRMERTLMAIVAPMVTR